MGCGGALREGRGQGGSRQAQREGGRETETEIQRYLSSGHCPFPQAAGGPVWERSPRRWAQTPRLGPPQSWPKERLKGLRAGTLLGAWLPGHEVGTDAWSRTVSPGEKGLYCPSQASGGGVWRPGIPGGKPGTDLGQPQEAPESDPELGSLGFGRPEPTLPPDLSGHLPVQPHTVFQVPSLRCPRSPCRTFHH